jgi:hypothetical protein
MYSGSCPRRTENPVEMSTPGATLGVRRIGRRKITACCLCLEEGILVIYRFRRPVVKIDIRRQRQEIALEARGFRYKNFRVLMDAEDFEKWRLRLMG